MAEVYICGSFRFFPIIEQAANILIDAGIPCCHSTPNDPKGIQGCLYRIDQSNILYVVNPDGYIGKSVALDIGYAYANSKNIFSMEPISDPPISFMVKKVLRIDELNSILGC